MAAEISFFAERYADARGRVDVFKRPALGVASVAIGGGSLRSGAAPAGTRFARIWLSASCRIRVSAADVVAVADGSDNQSEYFDKGEHVIGVAVGDKLAVIAAASA